MVPNKSPDEMVNLIAALLCDVQMLHREVISPRAMRLTIQKVEKRVAREGRGFLTKALPRLGKSLDKALALEGTVDAASLAFEPMPGSKLPKFLGELFSCVLDSDGRVLPCPDAKCVKSLRAVLYLFYKYELPVDPTLDKDVISKFVETERDVWLHSCMFDVLSDMMQYDPCAFYQSNYGISPWLIRRARRLLWELFRGFDPTDIHPRHGPGAVANRETGLGKYMFDVVSPRILSTYPWDKFFFSSYEHVCDSVEAGELPVTLAESFARVCLVPKDSRGRRLISCEPKEFQWVQQGLRIAIVKHVEKHPLTRDAIHFTDQTPNAAGALLGSLHGMYATLDLNEASDRVPVGLVRLLFPEPLVSALLNCRSLATVLPDGRIIRLGKYAPMGSALCFVVLALTIWAILTARLGDTEAESLLVYGDDVVVRTAQAENAMNTLELFGLRINRDKSCTKGFFRESCGVDAFMGIDVTPVKIHTVWQHHPTPGVYASFIAYANEFWERQYYTLYGVIADMLRSVYGPIPAEDMQLSCPSLVYVPVEHRTYKSRGNKRLQRREFLVRDVRPRKMSSEGSGWAKLHRFYVEGPVVRREEDALTNPCSGGVQERIEDLIGLHSPFTASQYTERDAEQLVSVWRCEAPVITPKKRKLPGFPAHFHFTG